jgi:hypothetical protein
MRRQVIPAKPWRPQDRFGIGFIGLMLLGFGVLTLLRSRLYYFNYWGGAVFAPFAVFIGVFVIVVAITQGPGRT